MYKNLPARNYRTILHFTNLCLSTHVDSIRKSLEKRILFQTTASTVILKIIDHVITTHSTLTT